MFTKPFHVPDTVVRAMRWDTHPPAGLTLLKVVEHARGTDLQYVSEDERTTNQLVATLRRRMNDAKKLGQRGLEQLYEDACNNLLRARITS